MKKAAYFAIVFYFIGLMTSCSDNRQSKTLEVNTDTIVQERPEVPDKPAITYSDAEILAAEDTLWYQDYLFASYPIPESVKARMQGKSMKDNAKIGYDQLCYLSLPYYDYDGHIQKGEMVCNKRIAHDLLSVFKTLFSEQYPICSIRLVDDFDADDEASMEANNTSCFNYRTVPGTSVLSRHALGLAVDINPLQNPYIRGSKVHPATATEYVDRTKDFPHKIDKDDLCYKVFTSYGFTWGGIWRNKDHQHFEKRR